MWCLQCVLVVVLEDEKPPKRPKRPHRPVVTISEADEDYEPVDERQYFFNHWLFSYTFFKLMECELW